ncbi:MAG: hypothetical protein HQL88_06530, partial [Magnetococcales bacterium]|nr:hypothetical protein [Magnetococcales bacterium]
MDTLANREQQLFLIMGGVVFTLIIGVAVYDMLENPDRVAEIVETSKPVTNPPPEEPAAGKKSTWFDRLAPASIFVTPPENLPTVPETVPTPVASTGQPPAAAPAPTKAAESTLASAPMPAAATAPTPA